MSTVWSKVHVRTRILGSLTYFLVAAISNLASGVKARTQEGGSANEP